MKIPLRRVAEALGRKIESEVVVTGWSVDSRTLQPGDLFFALRGPNHDGHAYIEEVFRKGAVAVVADRDTPQANATIRASRNVRSTPETWRIDRGSDRSAQRTPGRPQHGHRRHNWRRMYDTGTPEREA